jgi:hypothetical protein
MKTSDTHAFIHQLVICLLVTFGFGGSVGLSIVWQRHQNALLANSLRVYDARIAEIDRHITETLTKAEGEKSSDVLRHRNTEWSLGLAPVAAQQVQTVTEDPVMRLARRHNGREFLGEGVRLPTIRVALSN